MGDIDISKIKQSQNIRQKVHDTEELAKSIQQKGLLQPILVRTLDGYFEIVAIGGFVLARLGMEKDRLSHNRVR
jgi:ParB-like chromosome segregation protein Spo0J